MILYHASPFIIEHPDVSHSREHLDFGKGFYLTTIRNQAEKYAMRFIRRGQKAYINEYMLNDDLSPYQIMIFERYDEAWLKYVGECRKGITNRIYDIVSGGIADDKVFKRLAFERPNHQICILNQDVILSHLRFLSVVEIKIGEDENVGK